MLALGPVVFAAPWVLLGLGLLPVIFWLLRVTPPSPRVIRFPAIRLLYDLVAREETPQRTPLWLLLLRLFLAALVIVGLARPLLNAGSDLPGSGPVLLIVDNGWAAAHDWPARQTVMRETIDRAERQGRTVILAPTASAAPGAAPAPSGLLRPAEARGLAEAMQPHPWPTDRAALVDALGNLEIEGSAYSVWLSDGLGGPAAVELADAVQRLGGGETRVPASGGTALLLRPPSTEGADLLATLHRSQPAGERDVWVRATAENGRLLARVPVVLADGEASAEARLTLPVELRNETTRLDIESQGTAGAAVLLDARWRRRPVGVVDIGGQDEAQPLLSEVHYLSRALEPFSDIVVGDLDALLDDGLAVLLLPDGGLSPEQRTAATRWIESGGILVRFAGPLLAANRDELVPVRLRFGDRILSGALSWTEPMPLAPFEPDSPFYGLAVSDDVLINRQVLAEPTPGLADQSWARLADGTPLVTADRRGDGWLVLVHTTAGPAWSNLPLSGLFVEMLRRLVAQSEGVAGADSVGALDPVATLDGFGRLGLPPPTAVPLPGNAIADEVPSPEHPPGYYGSEDSRRALNLGAAIAAPAPLEGLPAGIAVTGYQGSEEVNLAPWLLAAALALATIDLMIALGLRGLLPRRRRLATAGAVLLALAFVGGASGGEAFAQTDDALAIQVANATYLAYAETGVPDVDEISRAGLESLSDVLRRRTAAEPAGAIGIDIATDELAFFPLIYWPVVPEQAELSSAAIGRINDYLRNGGMILFDTRDQGQGSGLSGVGPGMERLRTLTEGLDIPPLTPVPPEHVLTRAFYLMQEFPGRYAGGDVWVETAAEHVNDGVSSVIIGPHDWAAAWATDETGRSLFPVVPGGERQREMAYRFGVNLVMYALTGNYKADQVHVPAILERLGQ